MSVKQGTLMRTAHLFRCREEWVDISRALSDSSPGRKSPTPAQVYADAVWESKTLKANERLVCLCYANHAHDNGMPTDRSWVTTIRLMERTGLSKGAAIAARTGAVEKGWLADAGPLEGHEQIRVYRLVRAKEKASGAIPKPLRKRGAGGRFASTGPQHGPETGPPDEPVHAMDRFREEPQVHAAVPRKPVHEVNRSMAWTETGPRDGPHSLTDSLAATPYGGSSASQLAVPGPPEFAIPLIRALQARGLTAITWNLSGNWALLQTLINTRGVAEMADHAAASAAAANSAGKHVRSANYFLGGWKDLAPKYVPNPDEPTQLRAVPQPSTADRRAANAQALKAARAARRNGQTPEGPIIPGQVIP